MRAVVWQCSLLCFLIYIAAKLPPCDAHEEFSLLYQAHQITYLIQRTPAEELLVTVCLKTGYSRGGNSYLEWPCGHPVLQNHLRD